jgi:hypothetical protein
MQSVKHKLDILNESEVTQQLKCTLIRSDESITRLTSTKSRSQ